MKRILSVILSCALLLGMLASFSAFAEEAKVLSVDGAEKTFAEFLSEAEGAEYYAGKTVKVLADFTPVYPADVTSIPDFRGTLDGDGHSINGLTAPLFAKLTGATVKNLTLNGEIVYEGNQCGALASQSYETVTLESVTNNCNISFTQTGSNASGAGLVGFSNNKIIVTDCVNNGNVAATSRASISVDVGGIVGYVKGTGCEIVATRCVNNGKLTTDVLKLDADGNPTGSNPGIIGGIAAWVTGPASFVKCVNNGTVEVISVRAAGGHKTGGIAGVVAATSATFTFDACVNTGNVKGYVMAGGIIGEIQSQKVHLKNCYNYGNLTSGGDTTFKTNSFTGGIIAYQRAGSATIEACANFGTLVSALNKNDATAVYAGGIVGLTDTSLTVLSSSSSGSVQSGRFAGGIIGYVNKDGGDIVVNGCFVSGTVGTLEEKLSDAAAGALIGKINKGNVTLPNTAHLASVNAVSYNGTVTDAAEAYAVETEAAWRALQQINYEGVQYSQASDGKFDIRLVASLPSLDYLNTGYEVIRIANGEVGRINTELKALVPSIFPHWSSRAFPQAAT